MNLLAKYRLMNLKKRLHRPNSNYDDILIHLMNIGPVAIPSLLELSESDNHLLRISAVNTLGMIKNNEDVVNKLVRLLFDSDLRIRKAADDQLDRLGWQPSCESVANHCFAFYGFPGRNDDISSNQTIVGLLSIKEVAAIPLILRLLKSQDVYDRIIGCQCLGNIGDPSVVPDLIEMIHDPNPFVRYWATYAFAEIGVPSALEGLKSAVCDYVYSTRKIAAWALGEINSIESIPILENMVTDPFPGVRGAVIGALSRYDAKGIHGLEIALLDQTWQERVKILRGDPNDNVTSSDLKMLFKEVREEAAKALAGIGSKRAMHSLSKALTDEDPNIRDLIVKILDGLGWSPTKNNEWAKYHYAKKNYIACSRMGELSLDILLPGLFDSKREVREGIANALDNMGWHPKKDKYGAAYFICHRTRKGDGLPTEQYEECVKIGPNAIDAVLTTWRNNTWNLDLPHLMYGLLKKFDNRSIPKLRKALIKESGLMRINIARILDNDFSWEPSQDIYGAAFYFCLGKFDNCASIGVPAVEVMLSIVRDDYEDVCAYYMDGIFRGVDVHSKMDDWLSSLRYVVVKIGENAIPTLQNALKSPSRRVRTFAVSALDDLEWEPTEDEYGIHYYIIKGEIKLWPLYEPFQFGNKLSFAQYDSKELGVPHFLTNDEEKYIAELKMMGDSAVKILTIVANDADYRTRNSALTALNSIFSRA